jgi:hypothetical protein
MNYIHYFKQNGMFCVVDASKDIPDTFSMTLLNCSIFSVVLDVFVVFHVTNHHDLLQSQQESTEK